jgi:hypothetical protein
MSKETKDWYRKTIEDAVNALYFERDQLRRVNDMLIGALEHIAASDTEVSKDWIKGVIERARASMV